MVEHHYRWDFIGLSTDSKPTPATSEKVTDGSTFYESNTSKLFVWYKDQWYEKVISGGELPIASSDTLGGVKVGDNLSINSETGVLSATDTTYSNFTGTDGTETGTAGLVPAPSAADANKFLKSDGTWETTSGGGVTVVQATGSSTTDVMSQDATTKLVYVDDTLQKIKIGQFTTASGMYAVGFGRYAQATGDYSIAIGATGQSSTSTRTRASSDASIAIGHKAYSANTYTVALGYNASAINRGGVALGANSTTTRIGEINVGSSDVLDGFNNTNYRVIGGVHDGQTNHDAATVAQGNTLANTAPTTSTVGVLGQLYTDTTNMHTYQCTAISSDTYTWTQRW